MRAIAGQSKPERPVDRRTMAGMLGISVATLDRMVANGEIPSSTYGRRVRRFVPSTVNAHLARAELRQIAKEEAA